MRYLFKEILLIGVFPLIIFWINVNHGVQGENFTIELVDFLLKNDSISVGVNLNERIVTRERVKRDSNNPTNVVVIGSSRSMLFGKPIGKNVKNYSMNGAILSDFENVYSEMKRSKVEFDSIYIEISPWIFNDNVAEKRYRDWGNQDKFNLRRLKMFLSVKYFLDNISFNKFGKVEEDKFIKYSDGSIKYDKDYRTANSRQKIINYLKKSPIYHLEGFNEIRNLNPDKFLKFVSMIRDDGKFIVLVKHPYPPSINDSILSKYPNILKTDSIINSISGVSGITAIGSFFPDSLGIIDSDYYDGMHLTPEGLSKLLD